jgi:uncharacterized protein YutE (UPF0331/DUF86 family)
MVEKEELFNRLKEIAEAIEYLKKADAVLLKNREKFILARYYLQMLLEGIFAIGNQIIANGNFRKPSSYREILKILFENNVIDAELSENLDFAARLRNELVHMYWKASIEDIIEIKTEKMEYFEKFTKLINEYLSEE